MELFPKDRHYNENYSWVVVKGEIAEVGLTKALADTVKEFVLIELPKKGAHIKKGDTYVSLESIKWSGHLVSPLSGEIVEVNEGLFDEPKKLNEEPYKHWIMKLKLTDRDELKQLMDAETVLSKSTCKI